ncbi:MAG: serine--tRNA ligase [Flavobacteriaceae bacterium]|jgi:seryl-tRNA synthetase|nr:serine--tRNA ligase [Flavobacteriaceae bacterium]MCI5089270.1 serine--tRNA ligase [Flavobacteriaceae bacterium]CAI8179177.1 MAG: Serine--tRNA ligase [SAR116 cluster bacterium]
MLQIQAIRNNQAAIISALKKRHIDAAPIVAEILEADQKRRSSQTALDENLAKANSIAKEIGSLFKSGKAAEAQDLKEQSAQLKAQSKSLQESLQEATETLQELLYSLPNVPHESVVSGTSEADNEEIFKAGDIPVLHENALPHWELAKKYDLIDFELGVKIAGAGFPVYKGKGAKLQRALIAYFLDKNTEAGYTEIQPPLVVNEASGYGTGQLPDKEGQMYYMPEDQLYLIPTAEVPVTNIFRDVVLAETDFPIKYTAYTPCFRREAGSYGAHVRGLNRLHQFDKVEIVQVSHPDESYTALDGMVSHVKDILNELELPYRILRLCGGDLGFTSALTFDFELFSTAQDRWLEISSVSNFETFQANRLKLRFKDQDGKSVLAHTLNGSALALPRVLAGILENCQTPEGIKIPKVLQPYTGFDLIS